MANPRFEEVKIVVFAETSTQEYIPKVVVLGKELSEWNFFITNGILRK